MAKKQRQGVSGNPAKAAAGKAPAGAPGPGGGRPGTGDPARSPARARFERASAPVLLFLSRLPRWVFPVAMAAILVTGLLLPSPVVGGLLLTLIVVALAWLVALSWPLLSVPSRILRVLVVAALALVVFGKFTGRFG